MEEFFKLWTGYPAMGTRPLATTPTKASMMYIGMLFRRMHLLDQPPGRGGHLRSCEPRRRLTSEQCIICFELRKKGKSHRRTHAASQCMSFWLPCWYGAPWNKVKFSSAICPNKLKEGIQPLDRIIGRIF